MFSEREVGFRSACLGMCSCLEPFPPSRYCWQGGRQHAWRSLLPQLHLAGPFCCRGGSGTLHLVRPAQSPSNTSCAAIQHKDHRQPRYLDHYYHQHKVHHHLLTARRPAGGGEGILLVISPHTAASARYCAAKLTAQLISLILSVTFVERSYGMPPRVSRE
jgi:hypothetical protein